MTPQPFCALNNTWYEDALELLFWQPEEFIWEIRAKKADKI